MINGFIRPDVAHRQKRKEPNAVSYQCRLPGRDGSILGSCHSQSDGEYPLWHSDLPKCHSVVSQPPPSKPCIVDRSFQPANLSHFNGRHQVRRGGREGVSRWTLATTHSSKCRRVSILPHQQRDARDFFEAKATWRLILRALHE
jgi:hypothetical protein